MSMLDGTLSSAVFAVRNTNKAVHGDIGRTPVPIVQAYNSIHTLAKTKLGAVSDGAKALMGKVDKIAETTGANSFLDKIDDVGKAAGASTASTKIASITSKAVNPLLCVASGVRVLKDDDQYSALIEEGLAMGAMFGAERGFKHLRGIAKEAVKEGSVNNLIKNKTLQNWGNSAIKGIKNISKNKGGKVGLVVAAELLFVAASVCAFNVGKSAGKTITGRDGSNKESGNPFSSPPPLTS